MRRLAIALSLALALTVGCATWNPYVNYAEPQEQASIPTVLTLTARVANNLDLLYYRFGSDDPTGETRGEYILCMQGEVRGDTIAVDDFWMPHMIRSTAESAGMVPGGCRNVPRHLGILHNHPTVPAGGLGEEAASVCLLSKSDNRTFLAFTTDDYTFLQCGRRLYGWWHRTQGDMSRKMLPPPPGQLVEFPRGKTTHFAPEAKERFRSPAISSCPTKGWGLGILLAPNDSLLIVAHGPYGEWLRTGFTYAHPDGFQYRFDLRSNGWGDDDLYITLTLSRWHEKPHYDGYWRVLETHALRRHPIKCSYQSDALPSGDRIYFAALQELQRHRHTNVAGVKPDETRSVQEPTTPGDPSRDADGGTNG